MKDDSAVATAVGAVLLIVILFVALVVVQVSFVPQWEEEAESEHARLAQSELLAILTQAQQAGNETRGSVTLGLTMSDDKDFLVSSGPELPGEVGFSDPQTLQIASPELRILRQGTVSLAAINEDWVMLDNATTVTDVASVDHLRLRVHDPADADEGDAVTLEIIDGNGALAGTMRAYIDEYPSGYAVRVEVANALGVVLVDTGESRFQQDQPSLVWINALEDEYLLRPLLAGATGPLTLRLEPDGLTADFVMQGSLSDGAPILPGAGRLVTDFTETTSGSALTLHHRNQEFPDQRLAIEHGAIVLVQPEGRTFLVPPDIRFGNWGSTASLRWSDTLFTGEAATLSTTSPVRITLSPGTSQETFGTAPSATLNITTQWPALWSAWLTEQSTLAGWSGVTVSFGDGWVELDLAGPSAGTDHDLNLEWRHTTVPTNLHT